MMDLKLQPHIATISKSILEPVRLFVSPEAAGRTITAGFSFLQRITRSAAVDVWFPEALKRELDHRIARGNKLAPADFPAQWAAVRQFELLQEAGNVKYYDLKATDIKRALCDYTRSMRAGGLRVIVVSIGSYNPQAARDDLEILDRRLQDRISALTHMLYLEEQSEEMSSGFARKLAEGNWDYRTELPHIGVALGARDLFRPVGGGGRRVKENVVIPVAPYAVTMPHWMIDSGVSDALNGQVFMRVKAAPQKGQYAVDDGVYRFAAADCGREVVISYIRGASENDPAKLSGAERRHARAQQFFDILSLLPQRHVVHDMAIGLQLPDNNAENEWIYTPPGENGVRAFHSLFDDLFAPFDHISLSSLHERAGAGAEIKGTMQHMRGYGDRLNAGADRFYGSLAGYALQ